MKQAKPELIINGKKIEKYTALHQVDINTMTSRWIIETEEEGRKVIKQDLTEEEKTQMFSREISEQTLIINKHSGELAELRIKIYKALCNRIVENCEMGCLTAPDVEAAKLILGIYSGNLMFTKFSV
jgi:hypothetical protein